MPVIRIQTQLGRSKNGRHTVGKFRGSGSTTCYLFAVATRTVIPLSLPPDWAHDELAPWAASCPSAWTSPTDRSTSSLDRAYKDHESREHSLGLGYMPFQALGDFLQVGCNSISQSFMTRREAADLAEARQGEATTSGVI